MKKIGGTPRGRGCVPLVLTLIQLALHGASIVLFPGLALWAWRVGGRVWLWQATGLGVGVILLFAAVGCLSNTGLSLAAQRVLNET